MTDTITLTGVVGTTPRHSITGANVPVTNFRLASTQRRFDRAQDKWVDGETNWYSISTFRQLARNAAVSIHKGDRVVLIGRLRVREWQTADKSGTSIDIDADALGHDLTWGSANWARTSHPATPAQASDSFAETEHPRAADYDSDGHHADRHHADGHQVDGRDAGPNGESDGGGYSDGDGTSDDHGADGTDAAAAARSGEPMSDDRREVATPF